jgi:hypothetical protein
LLQLSRVIATFGILISPYKIFHLKVAKYNYDVHFHSLVLLSK